MKKTKRYRLARDISVDWERWGVHDTVTGDFTGFGSGKEVALDAVDLLNESPHLRGVYIWTLRGFWKKRKKPRKQRKARFRVLPDLQFGGWFVLDREMSRIARFGMKSTAREVAQELSRSPERVEDYMWAGVSSWNAE